MVPPAYITNSGDNTEDGTVSVIGTVTNTITVGFQPFGLAVSPDGGTAYVANNGDSTVSVIDTATNTVTTTINITGPPARYTPFGVALSPTQAKAYVTNAGHDEVFVIDTATNAVSTTITVGGDPHQVALSPDGGTAYVNNSDGVPGSLSVIETATNTITGTINMTAGSSPRGVVVSPDGATIYVTDYVTDFDGAAVWAISV